VDVATPSGRPPAASEASTSAIAGVTIVSVSDAVA